MNKEANSEQIIPTQKQQIEEGLTDFFGRPETASLEILRKSENPQEIALAIQRRLSKLYSEYIWWEKEPNVYQIEHFLDVIRDRYNYFSEQLPLGEVPVPEKWQELINKDPQKAETELKKITDAYERALARVLAEGIILLPKLVEQRRFGNDVDQYAGNYFTNLWKRVIPSSVYGVIFNIEASREGYIPLGWQVEAAYDAIRDIGEGKAVISLDNKALQKLGYKGSPLSEGEAKKVRLPNIFALPANSGLLRFAIEYYILPRLRKMRENRDYEDSFRGRAEKKAEDKNSLEAIDIALALFWHTDMDMNYSVATKTGEFVDPTNLTTVEFEQLNLEIGPFATDASKMRHAQLRQRAEHGGAKIGERREHIRATGNPMLFPATPNMTAGMFDIVTCELPTPEEIRNQLDEKLRGKQFIMPEKIKLSVNSWKYEDLVLIPVDVVVDGQKKTEWVRVNKRPVNFRDIPWDDVRVTNLETVANVVDENHPKTSEYLRFAMGPQRSAYEVPYKLQLFYAWGSIYKLFFDSSPIRVFKLLKEGDTMRKLNKQIDVALGLLANAYGLRPDTVAKLGNYLRTMLIAATVAGVCSQISNNAERPIEVASQTEQVSEGTKDAKAMLQSLLNSARVHTFLPTDPMTNQLDSRYVSLAEETIRRIIDDKEQVPRPSESKLFDKDELEEISPLYPFGV